YGTRSFDVVYRFTLQAVRYLFDCGCRLVILACNTASAKALRTIQQCDLPEIDPTRRVLGVIRPTVEILPEFTRNGHIGIVGTPGTVASRSYDIEIGKMHPSMTVTSHACPMWVPLVENREASSPGARYFVERDLGRLLDADPQIDTLILGCTHYPLLIDTIQEAIPSGVRVLSQGSIVADSLADYLRRHPDMASRCTEGGSVRYMTTESADRFSSLASLFMDTPVEARQIEL
ncbi:MAG: aspartate/glutamate racemase family protein, partial [Muribaculum intestinale]|nr:aspartate/glutamate racemase family protein [Muribaculum intestinale]